MANLYNICSKYYINLFSYHLIIGGFFKDQDKQDLRDLAKANKNIIVYENVSNMQSIMSKCDVAISAGGSTLYELAYLGIPTIAIETADNQRGNIKKFVGMGIMLFGGNKVKDYINTIDIELKKMNYNKRLELQRKSLILFKDDGKKCYMLDAILQNKVVI